MINGKRIVLTGASSGIGLEVLKLLKEGADNQILAVSRHAVEKLTGFAPNVTPFDCDVSSPEGIEKLFDKAESMFDKIDIFYANAGFPYYERYDYTDWERVEKMFRTNTFAPMYTYSRYLKHLNGREGHLAITVSAIGQMAMPGYAVYSASKFATQGFQQAVRTEKPDNLKMTCLYPVATDTNFFVVAADGEKFEKPFPVQKPDVILCRKRFRFQSAHIARLSAAQLRETVKKMFDDKKCGHIMRIKGFIPASQAGLKEGFSVETSETASAEKSGAEPAWYEVNATRDGLELKPSEAGQEVLIVIGEHLDDKTVHEYLPSSVAPAHG